MHKTVDAPLAPVSLFSSLDYSFVESSPRSAMRLGFEIDISAPHYTLFISLGPSFPPSMRSEGQATSHHSRNPHGRCLRGLSACRQSRRAMSCRRWIVRALSYRLNCDSSSPITFNRLCLPSLVSPRSRWHHAYSANPLNPCRQ